MSQLFNLLSAYLEVAVEAGGVQRYHVGGVGYVHQPPPVAVAQKEGGHLVRKWNS